jgi:hypothetical protein
MAICAREQPETSAADRSPTARRRAVGERTPRPAAPHSPAAAAAAPVVGALAPLGASRTWWRVIEAAGGRCEYTGACGSEHSCTGGRCPAGHRTTARLYAAPRDPTVDRDIAWRVPPEQLAAWCGTCLDAARRPPSADPPHPPGEDLLSLLAGEPT